MTGFYYLATPYSKHPGGVDVAHQEACLAAAACFRAGIPVFCPIAHTHVIEVIGGLGGGYDQWSNFDEMMIEAAAGLIVVTMAGWEESVGIAAEIEFCRGLGRPVLYMAPDCPPAELLVRR